MLKNAVVPVLAEELHRMGRRQGFAPLRFQRRVTDRERLLEGNWRCFGEGLGISMHCGDFEELTDNSHSLELPVGLSLSVIFSGRVAFSLAGQKHILGESIQPIECACFALARPDVLTRHMQRGCRVCKVNVFIEKAWLSERFPQHAGRGHWQSLFTHHATLYRWQPDEQTVQLCQQLLTQSHNIDPLAESLVLEAKVLSLIASILSQWQYQQKVVQQVRESRSTHPLAENIKAYLDRPSSTLPSLQQIANAHHSSISTVQRHFKNHYGITLNEYLRLQRLERAKKALVCEGLSIGEAAYLAGYSHAANFIAAFHKVYSITPAVYREQHSR